MARWVKNCMAACSNGQVDRPRMIRLLYVALRKMMEEHPILIQVGDTGLGQRPVGL
jgi:hypothetical protein